MKNRIRISFAIVVFVLSASVGRSQWQTNSSGSSMWPKNPPVGIGTDSAGVFGRALNSLHIHYNPTDTNTKRAILRLSAGANPSSNFFGILGLMLTRDTTFTSLANNNDLILHEHSEGDLIITNYDPDTITGSIRFATTGDTTMRSVPPPGHHDLERMTIRSNGNIGMNLQPDSATGLGKPLDQVQIGGSKTHAPLTIFGGDRFEGLPGPGGKTFSLDYRYLAFNHYQNHLTGSVGRFLPTAGSGVFFGDDYNGHVSLVTAPWHTGDSLSNWAGGTTLRLDGEKGLTLLSDQRDSGGSQFSGLFEVWRPGFHLSPVTRNTNGLFFHHTPVYIGTDTGSRFTPDFQNLPVHPDMGDSLTWMLVVNGPALFKEAFVNQLDWPDYALMPEYKLPSLEEVDRFIKKNHHLPGIPSADSLAKTGVPLGQTEAQMMKKIEELTLYIIDQNKRMEALELKLSDWEKGGSR